MILGDVLPPVDNKGGGLPFFWSFHTGESLKILENVIPLFLIMKW